MCVISASYGELTQLRYNGGSSGHNGDVDMEPTVKAGVVKEVPGIMSVQRRRQRTADVEGRWQGGYRIAFRSHVIITEDIRGTVMYNRCRIVLHWPSMHLYGWDCIVPMVVDTQIDHA